MGQGIPEREPNWRALALASFLDPGGARATQAIVQGMQERRRRQEESEIGDVTAAEDQGFEDPEGAYRAVLGLSPKTVLGRRARSESLTRGYKRYGEDVLSKSRVPDATQPPIPETTQPIPFSPDRAERGGAQPGLRYSDADLALGNRLDVPVSSITSLDKPGQEGPVPQFPVAPSEFAGYRAGDAATAVITPGRAQGTRRPNTIEELRAALPDDKQFRAALAAHNDLVPKQYAPDTTKSTHPSDADELKALSASLDKYLEGLSPQEQADAAPYVDLAKRQIAIAQRNAGQITGARTSYDKVLDVTQKGRERRAREARYTETMKMRREQFGQMLSRFDEQLRQNDIANANTSFDNLRGLIQEIDRDIKHLESLGTPEGDTMLQNLRQQYQQFQQLLINRQESFHRRQGTRTEPGPAPAPRAPAPKPPSAPAKKDPLGIR